MSKKSTLKMTPLKRYDIDLGADSSSPFTVMVTTRGEMIVECLNMFNVKCRLTITWMGGGLTLSDRGSKVKFTRKEAKYSDEGSIEML